MKSQEAMQIVSDAFQSHGMSKHNAKIIAHYLVLAETDGQLGHGLSRVKSYLTQIKSGKVNTRASIRSEFQGKGWLALDADHGFAFPALDHAYSQAMPMVRDNGTLLVTINKSHHAGVLGHHVERYAEQGVVALMFSNTPRRHRSWGI